MRKFFAVSFLLLSTLFLCSSCSNLVSRTPSSTAAVQEWTHYAGDAKSQKFSQLNLINKSNVNSLHLAWIWNSTDNSVVSANKLTTFIYESTPIMVDGKLLTSTPLNWVVAIDPMTGRTLWNFDPETSKHGQPPNNGFVHRGVTYWEGLSEKRVMIATNDAYLYALDVKTGKPVKSFGQMGRIDLAIQDGIPVDRRKFGVTSPPIVCNNTLIVGSSILDLFFKFNMPRGDVKGYDVKTGQLKWTFHTIPQAGEPGSETWLNNSWKHGGNANVWAPMSADEQLGSVYLPVSTPSNDWYGGERPGDGLFGESLVSLDCETGAKKWHYQLVHHGLWDYDPPAAPVLMNIDLDGKTVKAVVEVTKQAFVYAFDRETGKPLWPIVETPVPRSNVPGEASSPTQPIPTNPLPFDRQGIAESDVNDFSPEIHQQALKILSKYNYGPLYTPPSEKGTVTLPGWVGGASWAGAAYNPLTQKLFVPSITEPSLYKLQSTIKPAWDFRYVRDMNQSLVIETPKGWPPGLPLLKPPYGRVTAIDMSTGHHDWMSPIGIGPKALLAQLGITPPTEELGWPRRTHLLATPELLFAAQSGPMKVVGSLGGALIPPTYPNALKIVAENDDPCLLVLDPDTGRKIAKIPIPQNAFGAPMTYALNGRQFILLPVGGVGLKAGLVALTVDK